MGIPRPKKRKKREDWERNHVMIERAYLTLLKNKVNEGKMSPPTITEISSITGLERRAVSKHLEELDLESITIDNPVKLMANQILSGLAAAAMRGDAKCAQLYFEIVYKTNQKISIDHTTKGKEIPQVKTGDTFNLIAPEWQKEIEEFNAKISSGEKIE